MGLVMGGFVSVMVDAGELFAPQFVCQPDLRMLVSRPCFSAGVEKVGC